jgi:hypothetical protein
MLKTIANLKNAKVLSKEAQMKIGGGGTCGVVHHPPGGGGYIIGGSPTLSIGDAKAGQKGRQSNPDLIADGSYYTWCCSSCGIYQ